MNGFEIGAKVRIGYRVFGGGEFVSDKAGTVVGIVSPGSLRERFTVLLDANVGNGHTDRYGRHELFSA